MTRNAAVLGGLTTAVVLALLVGCSPSSRSAESSDAMWCGPPPAGSGGLWECTLADDFSGSRLDRTLWIPRKHKSKGIPAARSCLVDSPRTIAVTGGELRLTVRKARAPFRCNGRPARYISGGISTYHTFSQQYGRFAARFKLHATAEPGLHEAFWMWPDDRIPSTVKWPAAGEIDIVETFSRFPTRAFPYLHYTSNNNGGPRPGVNTARDCFARRGVFNTYELTWTPATLRISINGRTCLTNTSGDAAFQKPYIVLLQSTLGGFHNALTPRTPIPATMSVDWVRVWQWAGPGSGP